MGFKKQLKNLSLVIGEIFIEFRDEKEINYINNLGETFYEQP
jgi:hypothetical protein